MTRLNNATHDSQCTKQNMSLIINVQHNHFDPLRSTVYHNILPDAACTVDHFHTLPAKGTRNIALTCQCQLKASLATHTHSLGGQALHKREEGSGVVTILCQLFQCLQYYNVRLNHTREDLAPG